MTRAAWLLFVAVLSAQEPPAKFGTTVVINSGLRGDIYFLHSDTKWLPDFRKMKPKGTIYTSSLNIPPQNFKEGFPGVTKRFEWFAIVYTGRLWIANPGDYRFVLTSDDGAKLWVDDRLAIDNDGIHWAMDASNRVTLTAGIHSLRVAYFQGPRQEVALILKVAGPGQRLHIFNTDEFKPPDDWK
ncbi:MAG: hypothetical protein JWP63_6396 [Candidatus Solibacter sp.]|jgi:hypothetical protein|nr:hypothetical protein [Candidatus Solibacter sp.]